jgi:hypothetical protein
MKQGFGPWLALFNMIAQSGHEQSYCGQPLLSVNQWPLCKACRIVTGRDIDD